MKNKSIQRSINILNVIIMLLLTYSVNGQITGAERNTLIQNIEIFDGLNEKTFKGDVLVSGNKILKISKTSIEKNDGTTKVIDGTGKFLIPGLIDAHTHLTMDNVPLNLRGADWVTINLIATHSAKDHLLRGFTTVRNTGGNAIPLAKAIDLGIIDGPRIYPSGAIISQSGGHGDFGLPTDVPRTPENLSYAERNGIAIIADGVPEVLKRSREQLRQGATQLKLTAGGGVASNYDPMDVAQYTVEEFKAAVSAAENFDTYVTVHAYTPKAIQAAIEGGVKCIEHGQLADEETVKMMAEKGIWWSLQPFLGDEDANEYPVGSANEAKQKIVALGTDNAYKLAKKYNVKVAWGTDILSPDKLETEGKQLAKLKRWFSPYEILKMGTSTNAELLRMSGKRDPYQQGKIGEITEGAYADLIIVNGNPLEHIELISDPKNNFLMIMKDGKIYKNTLN